MTLGIFCFGRGGGETAKSEKPWAWPPLQPTIGSRRHHLPPALPTSEPSTRSNNSQNLSLHPSIPCKKVADSVARSLSIWTPQKPENAHVKAEQFHPQSYSLSHRPVFSPSDLSLNQCCAPKVQHLRSDRSKMALSKSQRIIILLAIDSAFFLVELVIGMLVQAESCLQERH